MTSRRATPGKTLSVLALAMLVVWLAWLLVGRGVALAMAKESPEAALRWHDGNPEALVRFNETELTAATKVARARAVLIQRPMDGRAYRQLAEVEAAQGRPKAARVLYRIAARTSPRDRLSQAWLADDALARGAVPEMIERINLLLNMDATLRPELFDYLAQLATHPEFRAELVELLVRRSSWRADFLAAWTELGTDAASLDQVFQSLLEHGAVLSVQERSLWVTRLLKEQRWDAAYRVWANGIDPPTLNDVGGVVNGGFEFEPAGEFDWRVSHAPGSRIDMLETTGAGGKRALRVAFSGRRVDFANVEQIVLLPPGRHSFQIRVQLVDVRSDRGLAWRVYCLSDEAMLGSGPALRGTRAWNTSSFSFTVPADCAAQRLRLELPARSASERMIGGIAWFDDAEIVPLTELADEAGRAASGSGSASPAPVPEGPGPGPPEPPGILGPGRTLQIVRSIVNSVPNAAGTFDPDVPVAP